MDAVSLYGRFDASACVDLDPVVCTVRAIIFQDVEEEGLQSEFLDLCRLNRHFSVRRRDFTPPGTEELVRTRDGYDKRRSGEHGGISGIRRVKGGRLQRQ